MTVPTLLVGSVGFARYLKISDTRFRQLLITDPAVPAPEYVCVESGRPLWLESTAAEYARVRTPRPALGRPRGRPRKTPVRPPLTYTPPE